MTSDDHDDLLRAAVAEAAISFDTDELAYLALTSKPEQHFRDRIAFCLYKRLKDDPVLVCREWNRVDLAVLATGDQTPNVLLELKWMYSMDAWADRDDYHRAVLEDEAKALRLATSGTSVYTLLLATHPLSKIHSQYWPAMKYASNVNSFLLLAGSAENIANAACQAANKLFGTHRICASGHIEGGVAYGVSASVMWWLMKAAPRLVANE